MRDARASILPTERSKLEDLETKRLTDRKIRYHLRNQPTSGMISLRFPSPRLVLSTLILPAVCLLFAAGTAGAQPATHDDLIDLFGDWRAFQRAPIVDGVPDYSKAAMAAQHAALRGYKSRLASLDTTGWTIPDKVDYHLVWAEMNGLDFDHRVLRPWENDPTFYRMIFPEQSDQPEREAPQVDGTIELWSYHLPLSAADAAEITASLNTIPELYRRARINLTGNGKDLWEASIESFSQQMRDLDELMDKVDSEDSQLLAAIGLAKEATSSFRDWLQMQARSKTGPSGIGKQNYNWYLKNVQLVPYTWDEQVLLIQRELDRALASLALEEHHNRDLPPLEPIASEEEFERRYQDAVTEYVAFMRDNDIVIDARLHGHGAARPHRPLHPTRSRAGLLYYRGLSRSDHHADPRLSLDRAGTNGE